MKAFNENLIRAYNLALDASSLAEKGQGECNDDSCRLLYDKLQATASELLALVEKETEGHKAKGKWG